jgi:hypothetical protein
MKNNLLFDFTVDKAAKTVYITREFTAELSLVWSYHPVQSFIPVIILSTPNWGIPGELARKRLIFSSIVNLFSKSCIRSFSGIFSFLNNFSS